MTKLRQLKHRRCGRVLDLVYVPRPSKDGGSEPALSCPEHGTIVDLSEVDPPGSVCVVREERNG